jgi:poly-gamma-glutamate capsule biosynthesis protein CapA/YwtB (metallophosphatase superfamily)
MKKFYFFSCLFLFHFVSKSFAQEGLSADSIVKLNLLFVGDIMGHGPQIRSAEIVNDKKYNYLPCFKYIRPILEQADLAIGNLELTLPGKPPYQGYPQFRSPDELAYALRLSGFDLMVTSNNHSNDAGKVGVINTISTLKGYGFYQTGTFKNSEEKELFYPLIVYKNGFKLAFLNYTYGTNGLSTKEPTLVNLIDTTLIKKDLKLAQQLSPDAIIVVMHWGQEYKMNESSTQRRLSKKIFEWGANLVVGSHPHVVQPIKQDSVLQKDSTFKKVVVAYSLGNFISNQTKPNTDGGIIFETELVKNLITGKVTLGENHYIPIWRYIYKDSKKKSTYHVVPVSAFEKDNSNLLEMLEKDKKAMINFATKTRNHLNKYDSSERYIKFETLNLVSNKKTK